MNYLDFVDRALSAIDATVRATTGEYAMPVSVLDVGRHIVGDSAVDPVTFHNSPLDRGLLVAIRDLTGMGLLRDSHGTSVRLTPNGRLIAGEGLRGQWPELVERFPLSDEARQFLNALCTLTEKDYGEFVELYVVDSGEILPMLEGTWSLGRVVGVWQELAERQAVSGALVSGGVSHARPTYIGFVLAKAGPAARLIQLVEELVETWEGANVDHKVRLEVGSDERKAELARDVAALANTQVRGSRYLVIGFDNASHSFAESFDATIDQDRLEDILGTRLSDVPGVHVDVVPWPGGIVGLVEIRRHAAKLPYTIARNLTDKIRKGDVFVRRGSHVARTDDEERGELIAERTRAIAGSSTPGAGGL